MSTTLLRATKWFAILCISLMAMLVAARKCNSLFRPDYPPQAMLASPNGVCALVEYKFRGGERGYLADPFRALLMLEGDAFYNVIDLSSGKILRDSTNAIPALPAISQGLVGMGSAVFYWSKDGTTAAFPGGEGPFHEWTGIRECEGTQADSQFAGLRCHSDSNNPACSQLRTKLDRR